MTLRYFCFLAAIVATTANPLRAEEAGSSGGGTLQLEKKTYTLKHAVAYEATVDDEGMVAVVVSGPAVTNVMLKEARAAEKDGGEGDFTRPFLKLIYTKGGELKYWSAAAGGTTLGRRSSKAAGELKLQDGKVTGRANQPLETEGMFPAGFEVKFDVALLREGESLAASATGRGGPAAKVQPTVTGVFKGNGKEARLNYISARWGEPFDGKPGIVLVMTEKDHSKDKKADSGAMFGRFGNALIISMHEDGKIYGCQVVHSAHKRKGFSSLGQIEATDFSYQDGKVEGELTTQGEVDVFGETWEADLKFVAPLGEVPATGTAATKSKAEKPADDERETKKDTQPAGPAPKARELALPKDASAVEYKSLVHQLTFSSKSEVKAVCAELAANLKGQGWKTDGTDMVQPASSILKRKRGGASLTIFVKPAATGGSEVRMMTEGLSWDE